MIIVVPSCLKDADGARTRSDQKKNMQNSGLRLSDTVCTAPLRPKKHFNIQIKLNIKKPLHMNRKKEDCSEQKTKNEYPILVMPKENTE
jgi:hypothetical protein